MGSGDWLKKIINKKKLKDEKAKNVKVRIIDCAVTVICCEWEDLF